MNPKVATILAMAGMGGGMPRRRARAAPPARRAPLTLDALDGLVETVCADWEARVIHRCVTRRTRRYAHHLATLPRAGT
jgi:hypothetical protein